MIPDSETLTKLLADATPGEWVWRVLPRRMSLRVVHPVPENCIASWTVILETDGDRDDANYRGATDPDRQLIALARPLAEEVIRLRQLIKTARKYENIQTMAIARAFDALMVRTKELSSQHNIARKEAKKADELRARIDAALAILDDPDDYETAIIQANEALWGDK